VSESKRVLLGRFRVVGIKIHNGPVAKMNMGVYEGLNRRVLIIECTTYSEANEVAIGLEVSGYEILAIEDRKTCRRYPKGAL
jgi:hypothetical protein